MHGRLTRDEIQQRGRWASANSMRKYLQPDKVHAQVQDLPTSVRDKLKRRMARRYHISNVTPPPVASDGGDEPRIEPLGKEILRLFRATLSELSLPHNEWPDLVWNGTKRAQQQPLYSEKESSAIAILLVKFLKTW